MAIYGRFGDTVTIVRMGTLDDVKSLDRRKPDQQDRDAVKAGSYVVTKHEDDGAERLHHLAFLRADGGLPEIMNAVRAVQFEQRFESVQQNHYRG